MFNLLIHVSPNEWGWHETGTYTLESDRVLVYCDDPASEYRDDIQRCKELPCLFSYERFDEYGRIGRISSITEHSGDIDISYSLDPRFPPIPIHDKETYSKFNCVGLECYRTHWAVKNIDLFETVLEVLAPRVPDESPSGAKLDEFWRGRGSRNRARVFLSHRADDRELVSKIGDELKKLGHTTFVAHDDIKATKMWREEILYALSTMTHFVGLVADDFHKGSWTDQEIGYSFARPDVKRIFIKLSDGVPQGLASFEQAAASSWDDAASRISELMNT